MPAANNRTSPPNIGLGEIREAAIVTDIRHLVTAANDAALKLLGHKAGDLDGWPLERIFESKPKDLSGLVAGSVEEIAFESRMVARTNRKLLMDWVAQPIFSDGQVAAILYLGRDTRVHHLVEAEIKKARNYFRSIVMHSPYGICVTDLDRNIIISNSAAGALTGYAPDDLISKPVATFYSEGGGRNDLDIAELRQGRLVTKETQFRRPDGSEVPVRVKYRLMEHLGERGMDVIFETYSDLTDRRKLDQLRNEFVFLAAHELRSPVTAIRLLLNLIFDDKRIVIEPILRDYLNNVQEAEQRLLQLVDDLLEVSRSEAGRFKISVKPQDIRDLVPGILTELKPSAVSREVDFKYEPADGLPRVLADASKLKEILANLISNAIKYNMAGGVVTVAHKTVGKMLVTSVSDTGIGISEADLKRLFEKFWRSEDKAVRAQPGTGLGLFIVRELVERMGGTVKVKAVLGKGTTFSFTLPIVDIS